MTQEPFSRLPLFAGLHADLVGGLLGSARILRRRKDSIVFAEGEDAQDAYIVLRGTVELTKLEGKADCGVMLLSRGDIFLLGAVLGQEPYLTSARALTPVILLAIPAELLRRRAAQHPELSFRLLTILAGQWRMAARQIIDLKCRSAAQRLAAFLLRLVDNRGETASRAQLHVPKSRVAARLGISPETLSRSLQTLAAEGLVVEGARIRVTDRARIERYCGLGPLDQGDAKLGVRAL